MQRYGTPNTLNASMTNADIRRHARVSTAATALINNAVPQMELSTRAYMRAVKMARTIADLDGSATITDAHMGEALSFRQPSEQFAAASR